MMNKFFKNMKTRTFLLSLVLLISLLGGSIVSAEDWPKGKITMIIPYKAGGSSDAMGRGLVKYWEKHIGVPIIIDNRDGASSQVGTTIYSKMPVDGNTIYLGCQVYFSANVVVHNAKYKLEDFETINIQQEDMIEIVVANDSPYINNPKKLFEDIKARPGQIKGGYIAGGPQNIAASVLAKEENLDFKTITYDNGNTLRTALLGGHIDFMIGNGLGDLSVLGKATPIVILGEKKSGLFPDVPLFKTVFGRPFPHLSMSTFVAVHSELKAKHPERYKKILESYIATMNDPEYKQFLKESKQEPITQYIGPEKSKQMMDDITNLVIRYKENLVVKN